MKQVKSLQKIDPRS
jgi:hypothetical protein